MWQCESLNLAKCPGRFHGRAPFTRKRGRRTFTCSTVLHPCLCLSLRLQGLLTVSANDKQKFFHKNVLILSGLTACANQAQKEMDGSSRAAQLVQLARERKVHVVLDMRPALAALFAAGTRTPIPQQPLERWSISSVAAESGVRVLTTISSVAA